MQPCYSCAASTAAIAGDTDESPREDPCLEEVQRGAGGSLVVRDVCLWVLAFSVDGNLPTSYFWSLYTHLDSLVVAYWG